MPPQIPFRTAPMLATAVDKPFDRPNWTFEPKYDGYRLIAYKEGAKVSLISRNDIDRTDRYPEVALAVKKLKAQTLVLDGEVVVFDAKKISRFQLLQQGRGAAHYVVFDCLYANGEDFRRKPLSERRSALLKLVKPSATLLITQPLASNGIKAFHAAAKQGLEGIVAKNLASIYFPGRSTEWLKVKAHQEDEFIIGGFTKPAGARQYFGALLLGLYNRGKLDYVGKVGTGFNDKILAQLHAKFMPLIAKSSPFAAPIPEQRKATFVAPKLVAQISYAEWTEDHRLRHPVFLGLRDDKDARQVVGREG